MQNIFSKFFYVVVLFSAISGILFALKVSEKELIKNIDNEQVIVESKRQTISPEYEKLLKNAAIAREQAYAPYSKFKVGAAVLTEDDTIFTGCNVENASYGSSICAERCAIFKAVSKGHHKIKAIAVTLDDKEPGRPCGACRQVIREFGKDVVVIMSNIKGDIDIEPISELLPKAFVLEQD